MLLREPYVTSNADRKAEMQLRLHEMPIRAEKPQRSNTVAIGNRRIKPMGNHRRSYGKSEDEESNG
jgi:hypothetical protein